MDAGATASRLSVDALAAAHVSLSGHLDAVLRRYERVVMAAIGRLGADDVDGVDGVDEGSLALAVEGSLYDVSAAARRLGTLMDGLVRRAAVAPAHSPAGVHVCADAHPQTPHPGQTRMHVPAR